MRSVFAALIFAALLLTASKSAPQRERKSLLSSFCQFSLSEQLIQTSISFSEVYTFTLDENGKARGIKRVSGDYVDLQEVTGCINRWEFSGFAPKSRVTVSFTWRHAVGWIEMKVISKDFTQTTLLNGDPCPGAK
jgi:hypothetical protein